MGSIFFGSGFLEFVEESEDEEWLIVLKDRLFCLENKYRYVDFILPRGL